MVGRREPVDRVVDALVAAPVCALRAARMAAPVFAEAIRRGITVGPPADHRPHGPANDPTEAVASDAVPGDQPSDSAPSVPEAGVLAIDDYDHLAARQVVDRLGGLDADELDAIEAYERANRHRQTILRRIEQLRT